MSYCDWSYPLQRNLQMNLSMSCHSPPLTQSKQFIMAIQITRPGNTWKFSTDFILRNMFPLQMGHVSVLLI